MPRLLFTALPLLFDFATLALYTFLAYRLILLLSIVLLTLHHHLLLLLLCHQIWGIVSFLLSLLVCGLYVWVVTHLLLRVINILRLVDGLRVPHGPRLGIEDFLTRWIGIILLILVASCGRVRSEMMWLKGLRGFQLLRKGLVVPCCVVEGNFLQVLGSLKGWDQGLRVIEVIC